MSKEKYALGLDIGISSVGWGMVRLDEDNNPERIIDVGVKIFTPGEVPKTGASKNLERRMKRGTRRILRRREFRVDRVRSLLNLNGYLGDDIETGLVSDINDKLTTIYENMVNKYYLDKDTNPYELKVEALDRKLNRDELSIILVHYAKHRGYKSNREEDSSDNDNGKVKKSIKDNETLMEEKGYRIISEMFVKDAKFDEKIRNSNNDYKMCVSREMYLDEINKVLDSQIKFGFITKEFKDEYINIWSSQRHYSKGPGGDSKYGGNLIEKMTGKCKFDNLPRAPKCAASSELFVAITNLLNLRYKSGRNGTYTQLTSDKIKTIIDLAKEQDTITYNKVFKTLKIENGIIKGLSATNKEKSAAITKFNKKYKLDKFEYSLLTEEQKEEYDLLKLEEISKRECIKLKNYSVIRKAFVTQLGSDEWNKVKDNYELLDLIAKILTDCKLDEDVIKAIKDNGINELYQDVILSLPNFKDHMMLSSDLIRKLNKLMIEGIDYDKAMAELGINHSDLIGDKEKEDLLIPINQDDEINNQRVIRSLAQSRGIINSIIKKYGMPERINIETARELSKSYEERRELTKRRDENKEKNDKIKNELVSLGFFKNVSDVKSMDVLKYKLWNEQLCKCAYSLEDIPLDYLFNENNLVQVDHILPYSRTFDDTYFNKTLVLSKYNQDKGNKTPYEWFGKTDKWEEFAAFIYNLDISEKKKDNYLLTQLTPEIEAEYRNQNLNDTKYISKYLVSYIKANLNVPKVGCPSGSITGKLRNYWHLNGLTHSLESETYYINENSDAKKNRENHLHHAMDALIIAISNNVIIRKVSTFEKYKRELDNKTWTQIEEYAKTHDDNYKQDDWIDSETGEVIFKQAKLLDYIHELKANEFFTLRKNNTIRTYLPEPYEGFAEEAKIRVYEQNKEVMDFKLKGFNYTPNEVENALPIIPKFAKNKIGGSLHGETYSSLREYKDGENIVRELVNRIDIASSKFDSKKLENIIDKNAGSSEVYETIKKWLGDFPNGEAAFKKHGDYPVNLKSGNKIKKVKIVTPYDGKGHMVNNNIVAKENIFKINVYKSKDETDDKLYFAGFDAMDLFQIKEKKNKNGEVIKKANNIDVDIWWARDKNHKFITYENLLNNYSLYISLDKNDLIEIEMKNGIKGRGYVNGFSIGLFEIKSVLGDSYDLVGEKNMFSKERNQYHLTVSQIKSIKKVKLNNLGKIE